MRHKIFQIAITALLAAVIILAAQALLNRGGGGSLTQDVQAQSITDGRIYTLNQDSYVITASSDGRTVYLYYLDIKPKEEESKLTFITWGNVR